MSKKALVPVNVLATSTEPTGQRAGDMYYNTESKKLRTFDGTVWADIVADAGGAPTGLIFDGGAPGTQYADISIFDGGSA